MSHHQHPKAIRIPPPPRRADQGPRSLRGRTQPHPSAIGLSVAVNSPARVSVSAGWSGTRACKEGAFPVRSRGSRSNEQMGFPTRDPAGQDAQPFP